MHRGVGMDACLYWFVRLGDGRANVCVFGSVRYCCVLFDYIRLLVLCDAECNISVRTAAASPYSGLQHSFVASRGC